jgi:hypothetical protein
MMTLYIVKQGRAPQPLERRNPGLARGLCLFPRDDAVSVMVAPGQPRDHREHRERTSAPRAAGAATHFCR